MPFLFHYFYNMLKYRVILLFILFAIYSLSQAQLGTLDYFLQQGLSNSPLLKDLTGQIRSNSIDSLLIRANQKPQVNFDGMLYYAPMINGYGYSEAITNGGQISSMMNVSQTIFNRKTLEARYDKFGLQNQALSASSKITENQLKKAITSQYINAYSVSKEIYLNKSLLSTIRDEEDILKQLVEKGIYKQTNYLSFLIELQSQELALNQLEIEYQKEMSALNLICGIKVDTIIELSEPDIVLSVPSRMELPPIFLRFKLDSLMICNEKVLIDRNYKPEVRWFSDAGLLSNDPGVIYKNLGVSLGLSLSLPVYDGNQRNLNFEKLSVSEESRSNYQDYFKMQFNKQLHQLNEELRKTREVIPPLKEQLELAASIIKQSKTLLNTGELSITDYIIAIKNYITIQVNLNQYEIKILRIINEINYWQF
jgi:outer membrane protein TolC